jgi:hypothetical protein
VSTSGIGINNNNLDGANQGSGTGVFANTTITSADESFVINPEQDVDTVRVFIDNAVGGYNTATEDLYYILYYTDGTVSDPILVEDLVATEHGDPDVPQAAQGGSYFDIPSGDKKIEAVQLTMGAGTVKIPVIEFTIEQEFEPAPLTLDFTAELSDEDGDSSQDSFTIHLTDA